MSVDSSVVEPAKRLPAEINEPDIRLYSHSPILYWWPVWLVGFVMAIITAVDGGRMVYVPPGTQIEDRQILIPEGAALAGPQERMAQSHYLGTILVITLLIVFISSNLAGYVFLSASVFAVWVASVFLFDHRTYIIFSAGQVRVLDAIGEAERVYDVTNMTFQVQPNIFLRHRIFGFWGAGDIIVRTGGPHPEVLEWPNVLFARSRLKQIQDRLKAREVV